MIYPKPYSIYLRGAIGVSQSTNEVITAFCAFWALLEHLMMPGGTQIPFPNPFLEGAPRLVGKAQPVNCRSYG